MMYKVPILAETANEDMILIDKNYVINEFWCSTKYYIT
jgi:hypothetical protein